MLYLNSIIKTTVEHQFILIKIIVALISFNLLIIVSSTFLTSSSVLESLNILLLQTHPPLYSFLNEFISFIIIFYNF